jgi:hypothetical protein
MDLFVREGIHGQARVADRLDLPACQFRQLVVVCDIDAELIAAASTVRVASKTTCESSPCRIAAGDARVDESASV